MAWRSLKGTAAEASGADGRSHGHELMVRAFCNVIPRAHQRLELRERGVDLPRHGALLGFFPDDFGRKLLEVAQHWCRELKDLDLAFELGPESLERNRILHVEVRERIDLDGGSGMV